MAAQTDPIVLAAQARAILQTLHQQRDVVVRFKTDDSEYAEDRLTDDDREMPGHFRSDKNVLTLNLDRLIRKGKPRPTSLNSIEDFRLHPVLAGAAAHESGHARWSNWDEIPEFIPNPDYDAFDPSTHTRTVSKTVTDEATGFESTVDEEVEVPSEFPVSGNGQLMELASMLEESRIERLAASSFSKTWRRAMQFSAGHLILEDVDEMNADGTNAVDSAVRMAAIVGGRMTAGTLGATHESRNAVRVVLESAQKIIEMHVGEMEEQYQTEDPYHAVMGLINHHVFSNDHDEAIPHLEAARQILKIIHPEQQDDPDKGGSDSGSGEGEASGMSAEMAEAMGKAGADMAAAIDAMEDAIRQEIVSEEEAPESKKNEQSGGHGSTLYKNPQAPQINRYEQPNKDDRALYNRARDWMERQIEPTVSETEVGQWLPAGGARLNVRGFIRDNLAGNKATQRTDWDRSVQTIKPAPPVKVGIMLDGSGSMGSYARSSAAVAWAASNAAADLPESRTVSVVYGNAAQVTQAPGHLPARQIAVSNTDGGTEDFYNAARMVEDALWLNDDVEDGEQSNTLIIIVSDLGYGGLYTDPVTGKSGRQFDAFVESVIDWHNRGIHVMVVGAHGTKIERFIASYGVTTTGKMDAKNPPFELVDYANLFKL